MFNEKMVEVMLRASYFSGSYIVLACYDLLNQSHLIRVLVIHDVCVCVCLSTAACHHICAYARISSFWLVNKIKFHAEHVNGHYI